MIPEAQESKKRDPKDKRGGKQGGWRRGAGRPTLLPGGGRGIEVYLDEATIKTYVDLGAGNLSKGIRKGAELIGAG